jgi:hypothetical protein
MREIIDDLAAVPMGLYFSHVVFKGVELHER